MARTRIIGLGALATCVAAGLVVSLPATRHALRRTIAAHSPVHFSTTTATKVVAVPEPIPSADGAADPRFLPRALADATPGSFAAPALDASGFSPPTATAGPTPTVASSAAGIDHSTEPTPVTPLADAALAVDLAGARQAMRNYHDGNLGAGDDFAHLTAGTLATSLEWAAIRLNSRLAGPARLAAFGRAHPDWPLHAWVQRRIEEARAETRDAPVVLAQFKEKLPETLIGTLSLARARIASGDAAGGAALVQEVWREQDLTPAEETSVLREFGILLRPQDHKFRADRLLYKENVAPALKAAALAGPDVLALAKARAAVIANASSDGALAAVPKPLQGDPGLLFARIQKSRRAGHPELAATLMQTAPREAALLVDGDQWWIERRLIARKLLDLGNAKLAYAIADGASAESPAMRIEAEFHAGWIALRFLDDPALAAPHFAAVSALAATPISVSRGAYWQGRTAEARGEGEAAHAFYAAAAALPTTFYGQLAAAHEGLGPIAVRQPSTPATGDFRAEAIRCVAVLFALGERDLALSLALSVAKTDPSEAQVAALAEVVEATGDARATLAIGKAGQQRGMPLDEAAFPTFGIPGYQPIEHSADRATVLAIARQESEFDPRSVSSAGAKGLMQLIDATARKTAQDAGLGFDPGRLLTDASFNARIGAAHLGKLLGDLDGSYILTFAAYNAGAGRVQEWIAAYGDPRKPGVDPVDWIERIPFTETRNYVQRVFENMQMYRAQLGMPTALLVGNDGKRT